MCGIFGGSAKEGKRLSIMKLMMLGMWNVERGVDSCGYYYAGNIRKGVGERANFNYLMSHDKEKEGVYFSRGELDCEVFTGHTRKGTSGAHTEENAHPHQVGNYVQTHNGVIKNIWTLCNKHGINHSQIHNDSLGLAHIINKIGFQVLNEYEGYASLSMTFKDDPNSLYLYHGESREVENGETKEERPLFILQQDEGIYYSSIRESLVLINYMSNYTPVKLPTNCVFKISKGLMTTYKYLVNREDNNIKLFPKKTTTTTAAKSSTTTPINNYGRSGVYNYQGNTGYYASPTTVSYLETQKEDKIYAENLPAEYEFGSTKIYYRYGRYYKYYNILLEGELLIDKDGHIIKEDAVVSEDKEVKKYYFIKGIMMCDKTAYERAKLASPSDKDNIACQYSRWSRYPVFNLENEASNICKNLRYKWYKGGKVVKKILNFVPKFSSRIYDVSAGKTKEIKPVKVRAI